ncbi:hypothetical protein R3P38DRAFT_3465932 [Favolaschia claudopus]|uniref:Uncharacterized protein n=1 Tax=Favolaschia claudopus TaxID=2862362 RepID=A0AAV9ZFA2_9AGAR
MAIVRESYRCWECEEGPHELRAPFPPQAVVAPSRQGRSIRFAGEGGTAQLTPGSEISGHGSPIMDRAATATDTYRSENPRDSRNGGASQSKFEMNHQADVKTNDAGWLERSDCPKESIRIRELRVDDACMPELQGKRLLSGKKADEHETQGSTADVWLRWWCEGLRSRAEFQILMQSCKQNKRLQTEKGNPYTQKLHRVV